MMYSLPANEIVWEEITTETRRRFVITSDRRREYYYIYRIYDDGRTERLGKGKNPPELCKKYVNPIRRA